MGIFLVIIVSAIAASFFSMLVYRLNNNVSLVKPANSICPKCRHRLYPRDLFPLVSYLLLGGRCRYCRRPISSDYFFLELSFIFWAVLGVSLHLAPAVILLNMLFMAVVFSDLRYREIPYTFTILAAVLILFAGYPHFFYYWPNLLIVFGFVIFVKLLEEIHYHQEVFGGADFLLYAILAFYFPTPQFMLLLYLSFILGALVGLFLLLVKKSKKNSFMPFAPFIVVAFYLVLFFGQPLLTWYTGLFYG